MLTKCMLKPLKLARLLEWNGPLGKPSAIMAIDITNRHVGIALAHHYQEPSQNIAFHHGHIDYVESTVGNSSDNDFCSTTTTLTPLPPIPYMSHHPYHPSYTSKHRFRLVAGMPSGPPRVQRTIDVAKKLTHIAKEEGVKGILVRWPGGGAGMGMSGAIGGLEEEWVREVEEGRLTLPLEERRKVGLGSVGMDDYGNRKLDGEGTMGYRRGRILYFLDKCCSGQREGNGYVDESSLSLLSEGARPFALWDSTSSEHLCILSRDASQRDLDASSTDPHRHHHSHLHLPTPMERVDKYGNPLTAMDRWGRAPIFGMPPDDLLARFRDQQRKKMESNEPLQRESFYYSSKYPYLGRRDKSDKKLQESTQQGESKSKDPYRGSIPAMCALHEFVSMHLRGRIMVPSTSASGPSFVPLSHLTSQASMSSASRDDALEEDSDEEYELFGEKMTAKDYQKEMPLGYRRSLITRFPKGSSSLRSSGNKYRVCESGKVDVESSKSPTPILNAHNGITTVKGISTSSDGSTSSNGSRARISPPTKEKPNGLASLVQMPKRISRRRGSQN